MDVKDIQSDLHALKRLYGLLKKDGDEASNFGSDKIDAHARLLLKNLLDLATKRALKAHSEIVSGQAEASGALSPARPQQRDEAVTSERPTPHSRLSIAVAANQKPDGREQSIHRLPSIGQKRCRICRRNTIKRLESEGEETYFYDAPDSITYPDDNQKQNSVENREKGIGWLSSSISDDPKCMQRRSDSYINGDADISSDRAEGPDALSNEASKAIEHIELYMSALRVGDSSATTQNLPLETESDVRTKYKAVSKQSTNNIIQSEPDAHIDVLDMAEESDGESRLLRKKVNKIYVQNVNARIEPVSWIISSNGCYMPNSIAIIPSETSYISPCWPSTSLASTMVNPNQSRISVEDEQSKPLFSLKKLENNPSKVLKNKKATLPILSSNFHGNDSGSRDKIGIRKDKQQTTAITTSLQNEESDTTATGVSSDSYSTWSSQKTSSRDSKSEDYSMTVGSRELESLGSSRSSGSQGGSGSQYRSFSEEEVSSSEVSSSGNEGYSSYEEEPIPSYTKLKRSTSKKSGPSRIKKAYKKQSGILKRLKDRLAVVFHHHHHHHHHHHRHHHNRGNDERSMRRNSSFDKHRGKAVDHKSLEEEYEAKAVKKTGNSQIREKKRQQNNFHGLVGGLMRHIRHSKKSKRGKGTNLDKFGRKKTSVNKSHWWQLLQHHQRSKPRLKLGIGKKKSRFKALPKID